MDGNDSNLVRTENRVNGRRTVVRGARHTKPGKTYFWTAEECQFVEDNYGVMPTEEIAETIGRSPYAIECQASRMGLKVDPGRRFSEEEDEFIRNNIRSMGYSHLAKKLNISVTILTRRVHELGVALTREESKLLRSELRSSSLDELCVPAIKYKQLTGEYPLMVREKGKGSGYGSKGGWADPIAQDMLPHWQTYYRHFGNLTNAWIACDDYAIERGIFSKDMPRRYRWRFGKTLIYDSEKKEYVIEGENTPRGQGQVRKFRKE